MVGYTTLMVTRIALVGDYDPNAIAHQAIPRALDFASRTVSEPLSFDWKRTTTLGSLDGYHGVWCVPASPYASEAAALRAIQWARETKVPFLGTCGGFQHAVLEFARNVLGLANAQHAETAVDDSCLVISRLACSLVEVEQPVFAVPHTRMADWYGSQAVGCGYHCSFGLNPGFEQRLETAGMRVIARDGAGEVRAMQLDGHPFFVGTLFQPERQALAGITPPVVQAFVEAASILSTSKEEAASSLF